VLPIGQAQVLLAHPSELDRLTHQLESSATQSNLSFTVSPILRVVADPSAQELRVLYAHGHPGLGDSFTTELDGVLGAPTGSPGGIVLKSFLIVNGLSTYPLTQSVINIGCDPVNQLVLDNPGIARMHAQLRFINDRFVIFDLASMGGTFVNGVAVSSHVLDPGDVILLAGVPLVYGQETAPRLGYTQELPSEPPLEVL
jgi:hypothetical protein